MKKTTIFFWILTGLLAFLMGFSGITNAMVTKDSIDFLSKHMGYPEYIIPFIGVAKILGSIVLLVPGFNRLKEWAYAGLTIDLAGAMYSFIALRDPVSGWAPLFIGFALIGGSYYFHHKKLKEAGASEK